MNLSPDHCATELLEVMPLVIPSIPLQMRRKGVPDFTVPQFRTLAFIETNEGTSLSDLAKHLGLMLPAASRIIDGLVKDNLANRRVDAEDRRRVAIALTKTGRAKLQKIHHVAQSHLSNALEVLNEAQQARLLKTLQSLRVLFETAGRGARSK